MPGLATRCLSRPLGIVIINLLLFIGIFQLLSARFFVNDDHGYVWILSGVVTGDPDPHLIHVNIITGYALRALYSLAPDIEWYLLLLVFAHFVAMTTLLQILIHEWSSLRTAYGFYALLFAVFEAPLLLGITFTTTAAVVALVGELTLLTSAGQGASRCSGRRIGGILLLVLALFIRMEAAAFVLLISMPVVLYRLLTTKCRRTALSVVLVGVTGVVLNSVHVQYYSWIGWDDILRYNVARGRLHDSVYAQWLLFRDDERTRTLLAEVGWSRNDADLFRTWVFPNSGRYSLTSFQELHAGLEALRREEPWGLAGMFGQSGRVLLKKFTVRRKSSMLLAFTCLVLVAHVGFAFGLRIPSLYFVNLIWTLIVLMGLIVVLKLPEKIWRPAFFVNAALTAVMAGHGVTRRSALPRAFGTRLPHHRAPPNSPDRVGAPKVPGASRRRSVLGASAVALLLLAGATGVIYTGRLSVRYGRLGRNYEQIIATLENSGQKVIYAWPGALPVEWKPLSLGPKTAPRVPVVWIGGWMMNLPLQATWFRRYGVEDIFLDLVEAEDRALICDAPRAEFARQYLLERYNLRVAPEILFATSRFNGYRFRRSD